MGLDLVPSQRHTQRYALIIMDERGVVLDRRENVEWRTIRALIDKYDVNILAIDNIYELGGSLSEIKKRLGKYIDKVKIIEVTKQNQNQYVRLVDLAYKEGLISERIPHLAPIQAAEISARLALKGVGSIIIDPSNIRTVIIISRGRSPGSGGMSQGRYCRSQRSAIKQVTDMILDELKKRGESDVECYVQKSKYGFERSVILLNSPPSQAKRWIKTLSDAIKKSGVNIKILSRVLHIDEQIGPLHHHDKPLIVGLDPGVITGLAIIDLNGNPLLITSGLALDKISIVRLLTKYGKPVVIASDVKKAPSIVEKVASLLGCEVYTPPRDLTIEEKRQIIHENVSNFKSLVKNAHQRDALAAALKAYLNFKSKFMQLEAKAKELNLPHNMIEQAKALMLKGLTIKEAIDKVLVSKPCEVMAKQPVMSHSDLEVQRLKQELSKLRDKIEEQNRVIRELEEARLSLIRELKEKEAKIEQLEEALIKIPRRSSNQGFDENILQHKLEHALKQVTTFSTRVKELELTIESLKDLIKSLVSGKALLVYELRSITKRSVDEVVKRDRICENSIILIRDPSSSTLEGLQYLLNLKPKAIITLMDKLPKNVLEVLEDHCIPVLDVKEVKLEKIEDLTFIDSSINDMINERRKLLSSKKDQKAKERFLEILRSYREERIRELENIMERS